MSRQDPQFNLRIPFELKARVEEAAKENKRSATAEIIARLEASFALSIPAAGSSFEDLKRQYLDVGSQISNLRRVMHGREAGLEQLKAQLDYLTREQQHTKAEAVSAIIEATTAEIAALEREYFALREFQHELNSKLEAAVHISDVRHS